MKIDSRVATIAGIVAIGTGFNVFWNQFGWQTPNGHSADIAQMEVEHKATNQAILLQQQAFRDEWWCDEEEEYLDELLRLKDSGDGSAALDQEIREQRAKMDDVSCHRFDKD